MVPCQEDFLPATTFNPTATPESRTTKAKTLKAVVIYELGGPEVLKVEGRPVPSPLAGQVLIKIKAFGLNRSEMFTRQGHSPV